MPLWGFLLSFVCATLWAASPLMVNRALAVSECGFNEINPIRSISYLVASLVIALVYTGGDIPLVTSPLALFYIFCGVFTSYTIGDILFFIAIREIGVSIAVPVSNAYPILVALTSWYILGEALTLRVFFGVLIVVAGLLFLHFGAVKKVEALSVEKAAHDKKRLAKGFTLAVLAGCAWAVSSPVTKLSMSESGLGPIEITFYRSAVFFIITWLIRWFAVRYTNAKTIPLRSVSVKAWLYLLGAAIVGLSVGSILYAACINVMPVAIVTAITATSPFMAALFGHFALKERLRPLQWCGVVLIIFGSVTVSL